MAAAAAAATPPTTIFVPGICSSTSILRPKTTFTTLNIFPKACVKRRIGIIVRATDPQNKETPNSDSTTAAAFISQEDVSYLIKVGAGSLVGAAAIKYGSIIFPEITTPNILQALTMIFAPVILALLLLIKQSSASD